MKIATCGQLTQTSKKSSERIPGRAPAARAQLAQAHTSRYESTWQILCRIEKLIFRARLKAALCQIAGRRPDPGLAYVDLHWLKPGCAWSDLGFHDHAHWQVDPTEAQSDMPASESSALGSDSDPVSVGIVCAVSSVSPAPGNPSLIWTRPSQSEN